MLKSTFLHFQGFGKKRERYLWENQVFTWEDYMKTHGVQQTLFPGKELGELEESVRRYESGDTSYFAERLPNSEFYRIALAYPKDVIFLDIETTGLSFYYDTITLIGWLKGSRFNSIVKGNPLNPLIEDLATAKVVVTYNGSLFDLKFLNYAFPELKFPDVHVDLRFLAKRVGLSGGQKKIEQDIGFQRAHEIEDIKGDAAPILWQKYCRGDIESLRKLIEYNFYDVDGMRFIIDVVMDRVLKKENIPPEVTKGFSFAEESVIDFGCNGLLSANFDEMQLKPFDGEPLMKIKYNDLSAIKDLGNYVSLGIDLVSAETRESGVCVLKGNEVVTCRLKTNQELLDIADENNVNIVSIDSPLTIPYGRTSVFDDDPHRDEFGILRVCERVLKKRGINSYPCLIPSMQKLTKRGIELATLFRKKGIPVIESYPGAAQDIMGIPRKQAGLPFLKAGLDEFGLKGDFHREDISHDELDAITSAIVGHFYWTGMCEGLGDLEEEFLFVPDLQADNTLWTKRKVVGLSGRIGSGKTTAAEILKAVGYSYTRYSLVLKSLLNERGLEVNRKNLQTIGLEINQKKGQRWLGKKLVEILGETELIVVDGLRWPEDVAFLSEAYGPAFKHIHIETDTQLRRKRLESRSGENVSFRDADANPVEAQIDKLNPLADYVIKNSTTLDSLKNQVMKAIKEK